MLYNNPKAEHIEHYVVFRLKVGEGERIFALAHFNGEGGTAEFLNEPVLKAAARGYVLGYGDVVAACLRQNRRKAKAHYRRVLAEGAVNFPALTVKGNGSFVVVALAEVGNSLGFRLAFGSIAADCQIRVPAALVNAWKTATNWSTYADHIVGV